MSKTKETLKLEKALYKSIHKQGVFCCLEVTIGWYGKERVDMLSYDTKGVFRCYEIKSSLNDFNSKAKKTFVGHYNYYVLTPELYDIVKDEIPKEIGVYVYGELKKRAKKQVVDSKMLEILKNSMIRSLSRYFDDTVQSIDESVLRKKDRIIGQLKSESKRNYRLYLDMKYKYEPNGRRRKG